MCNNSQFEGNSVISRFYEGIVNGNFLNKIKAKVSEAADHYRAKVDLERKRVREEEPDEVLLQMEDRCYKALPLLQVSARIANV